MFKTLMIIAALAAYTAPAFAGYSCTWYNNKSICCTTVGDNSYCY